jgi:hypothetical protein
MTTPISDYQKRKRSQKVTYTALLRYLQHYCAYKGRPDAYKRLLASAGVNLRKRDNVSFKHIPLHQVRRVLELYFCKYGAREIKRRLTQTKTQT